jgi:hypothetical protein
MTKIDRFLSSAPVQRDSQEHPSLFVPKSKKGGAGKNNVGGMPTLLDSAAAHSTPPSFPQGRGRSPRCPKFQARMRRCGKNILSRSHGAHGEISRRDAVARRGSGRAERPETGNLKPETWNANAWRADLRVGPNFRRGRLACGCQSFDVQRET